MRASLLLAKRWMIVGQQPTFYRWMPHSPKPKILKKRHHHRLLSGSSSNNKQVAVDDEGSSSSSKKIKLTEVLDSALMISSIESRMKGNKMKCSPDLQTLATLSSRTNYKQYLTNLFAVYTILEEELDATSIPAIKSDIIRQVWNPTNSAVLRRAQHVEMDLEELNLLQQDEYEKYRTGPSTLRKSMLVDPHDEQQQRVNPYTIRYLHYIRQAGEDDRETGGGRLLGHLYCRYYVDLLLDSKIEQQVVTEEGGEGVSSSSRLGRPYQLALQLPTTPRHLEFNFDGQQQQQQQNQNSLLDDQLYNDLNRSGTMLTTDQIEDIKKETILAAHYTSQEGDGIDAARGGWNYMLGWATSFGGGGN